MGAEIQTTGREVLLGTSYKAPGAVIHDAIIAGYGSAYRSRGILPLAGFTPPKCRWSATQIAAAEERSLIPCMTALAIQYLQKGGFYKRGKRVKAKGAAQ